VEEVALRRQSRVGLALAATLMAAWLATHVFAVHFYPWTAQSQWLAPTLVLALCWLDVGLFILAHDCMHGSLAPSWPRLQWAIGNTCVLLYAGFSLRMLSEKHHEHHRHPGTAHDPDFRPSDRAGFLAWYFNFFRVYSSWRQIAIVTLTFWGLVLALGASVPNVLVFWALPALLSSLQLFYFGTYLPHRPETLPFADQHRARTRDFPNWLSFLSCYHFGFHHEHHLHPHAPWWQLPRVRAAVLRDQRATPLHDANAS
jgi:beta-carotene/zeaxanthin 4-ketolase